MNTNLFNDVIKGLIYQGFIETERQEFCVTLKKDNTEVKLFVNNHNNPVLIVAREKNNNVWKIKLYKRS